MSKLVVATLGFDERLVLRTLFKIGLDRDDTILLIYSKTGDPYDVERVERAVNAVKSIVGNLGVNIVDSVVSARDFLEDVVSIVKAIARYDRGGEVVAIFTGGMRLIIIESIVALLLYKRLVARDTKARVLVMREDGLYDVVLPLEVFEPSNVTDRELEVLVALCEPKDMKRSEVVKAVASKLGISEYAVYKYLAALERKGFVSLEDNKVRCSLLGELVTKIASAVRETKG